MRKAKVLIPESARPDVVSPLIDGRSPPHTVHGKGCSKDGKEGGEKVKEVGKDDKLVPTEIDPGKGYGAREHPGL